MVCVAKRLKEAVWAISLRPGGTPMTPKFLHEQATYLRGMADLTVLKISKLKLLALAEDYEALARDAEKLAADEIMVGAENNFAEEVREAA
jgi:hypothetical protein